MLRMANSADAVTAALQRELLFFFFFLWLGFTVRWVFLN